MRNSHRPTASARHARPQVRTRRGRALPAGAMLAAGALLAGGLGPALAARGGDDAQPAAASVEAGDGTRLSTDRLERDVAGRWAAVARTTNLYASAFALVSEPQGVLGEARAAARPAVPATGGAFVGLAGDGYRLETPDPLGTQLRLGTAALRKASGDLAEAAEALGDARPDPGFATVAPVQPPALADESTRSPARELAALANRYAETAALSTALRHAIERFDGATLAGDATSARLQASATADLSRRLATRLTEAERASAALTSALRAERLEVGFGDGDRDRALAGQKRLRADGFTEPEEQAFAARGLDADAVSGLRKRILDVPVATIGSDLGTALGGTGTAADEGVAALTDLTGQALRAAAPETGSAAPRAADEPAATEVAADEPPVAELPQDLEAVEGSAITLTATASDPDGSIAAYRWDLGDGRVLEGTPAPSVSWPDDGAFPVTLTVTDDQGATAVATTTVTVRNAAPTASLTLPYARVSPGVTRPLAVTAFDPGADALSYAWDFGDGETSAEGPSVRHAWTAAGERTVTVRVTDDDGGSATATALVTVAPLTADAGPDVKVPEGGLAELGGPRSTPSDAYTTAVWDFGDGSSGPGTTATHTYAAPGTYTATLKLTDDGGTVSDSTVVRVSNLQPVVTGLAAPRQAVAGSATSFRAFAGDPAGGGIAGAWDFGDGEKATGLTAEHTFREPGTYTVAFTATDDAKATVSATREVRVSAVPAGVPDSSGTDFWIGFDANQTAAGTVLTLHVTGPRDTTGLVEIPGLGVSQPFSVKAGEATAVPVPVEAMLGQRAAEFPSGVEPRAVHVSADDEVTVVGLNRGKDTSDAFLAAPADAQGTRYRVMSTGGGYLGSLLSVVAGRNDTTVTVTPAAAADGHAAGTPFTVRLNAGEAYELRTQTAADLTGTLVTSDRPVSVFGGHRCGTVPAGTSFCNHLIEQLAPTDAWGSVHVTSPSVGRRADTVRVLADAGTSVKITQGTATATVALKAGEVHEFVTGVPTVIESDRPVAVAQFAHGGNYDRTNADPYMSIVPPAEQWLSSYTVTTPGSGFVGNYLNLLVPAGATTGVRLNGAAVAASSWKAVAGTGYSTASLAVRSGIHRVTADRPVGLMVYGAQRNDGYGYAGSLAATALGAARTLSLTPDTQRVAFGAPGCVTARVLDDDKKALAGFAVTLATDTPASTRTVVTDGSGAATSCWTSAAAGSTTVTAAAAGTSGAKLEGTAKITWLPEGYEPPTATGAEVTTAEDTPVGITLQGKGSGTLEYVVTAAPESGTLSGTAPDLTYAPAPNFSGTVELRFVVRSDISSEPATVRITVTPVDDPVVLGDPGPQTVAEGTTLEVPISAVDPDGDEPSLSLAAAPDGATLSGGTFRWTPGEADGPGVQRVTVRAAGEPPVEVTFEVTVTEVNQAPELVLGRAADTVRTGEDLPAVSVRAADADLPLQTLTVDAPELPAGVTLSAVPGEEASWQLSGTVSAAAGSYPVRLTASDGAGGTATATFTLTVLPELPPAGPALDTVVSANQTSLGGQSVTSPTLRTAAAGRLLVAFVGADGPSAPTQTVSRVTGGDLTWTLAGRANQTWGTAEVWSAWAPSTYAAPVTATWGRSGYRGSITVAAFSGAATRPGAVGTAADRGTRQEAGLTTTAANSLVWATGHTWDAAQTRSFHPGQSAVHQWLAQPADTFWTQRLDGPVVSPGAVLIGGAMPATARWQLAAVEIRAAG